MYDKIAFCDWPFFPMCFLLNDIKHTTEHKYIIHWSPNKIPIHIIPLSFGGPPGQAGTVPNHGIRSPGPGEICRVPPRPGSSVGYLPGAPGGPPAPARAARQGGVAERRPHPPTGPRDYDPKRTIDGVSQRPAGSGRGGGVSRTIF